MRRKRTVYDRIQYELVVGCEKPHELGLRDTGISGDVCRRLLGDFLQREFPHLHFDCGIVSSAETRPTIYEHSSKALGPQTDIIVYSGSPYERIYEYAVVPKRQVIATIEVKKWLGVDAFEKKPRSFNDQLRKLREFTGSPVFLAAFRHHGSLVQLKKKCAANGLFVFSSATPGRYPHYVTDFKKGYLHSGELLRLCRAIERSLR